MIELRYQSNAGDPKAMRAAYCACMSLHSSYTATEWALHKGTAWSSPEKPMTESRSDLLSDPKLATS